MRKTRWLGLVLLVMLAAPAPALAQGQISGRVLGPAGVTPVPGSRVVFFNLLTQVAERSAPADEQGFYSVTGLQPGRYDVAVETSEGLFLVEREVALETDENRAISFALRERTYWEGTGAPPPSSVAGDVAGTAVIIESGRKQPAARAGNGRRLWIGVGAGAGLLGVALAAGDSDSQASPFLPALP